MGVLDIIHYPNRILKEKCSQVQEIDSNINGLIDDMIESLKAYPGCVGIAAPQVGHSVSLIVVDVSAHKKITTCSGLIVLINPVIQKMGGRVISREGCLSLPDYTGNVKRAAFLVVRAMDPSGNTIRIKTEGFEAVVLQHEIDHLDGILFIDRITSLKTDLFRRKNYKK